MWSPPSLSTIASAADAAAAVVESAKAMPTSAVARAGASLIPSPTMAMYPLLLTSDRNSSIHFTLSSGSKPALTLLMPSLAATFSAFASWSPVSMDTLSSLSFSICRSSTADALFDLILSAKVKRDVLSLFSVPGCFVCKTAITLSCPELLTRLVICFVEESERYFETKLIDPNCISYELLPFFAEASTPYPGICLKSWILKPF
mmetsp:Transcript_4512/g.7871  ORF Transcript_4512/g.7871 Transcript_4512/m.7871 type:complete len:204 (-) Transcript_4512:1486-2097(-)